MIAVVSHDAGGAEILSSWVSGCEEEYCLALDGPAKIIFQRKLGICHSLPLDEAIGLADWVLCGTSGEGDFEKRAIVQARFAGKKTVAFLDHWVNYKKRFEINGSVNYPDEIWVGDVEALEKARQTFIDVPVFLKTNPYFKEIQCEFKKIQPLPRKAESYNVLYVCEPIRIDIPSIASDEVPPGYSEEEALNYFLGNVDVLERAVSSVKIRPHPKEIKGKYDWAIHKIPGVVEIGGDKSLLEEIANADVVVGCETMAMMVALLVGKKVISSIPPGGRPCLLPNPKIEHLQVLLGTPKDNK
jgi:hypothetical protein